MYSYLSFPIERKRFQDIVLNKYGLSVELLFFFRTHSRSNWRFDVGRHRQDIYKNVHVRPNETPFLHSFNNNLHPFLIFQTDTTKANEPWS